MIMAVYTLLVKSLGALDKFNKIQKKQRFFSS